MISRRHILNTTMALGVLVSVGALIWSAGTSEVEIPARPQAMTIQVATIPTAEEPLPQIRVPDLVPPADAEPGSSKTEVHVPPRPEPVLADLSVEAIQEPLPAIAVPELERPCSALPRTVTA